MRIFDDAVFHAVERVALIEHGLMDRGIFRGRDVAGFVLVRDRGSPDLAALQVRRIIGGRSGDDAVVIVRISLRFGHRLPAAGRAAVPVRVLRSARHSKRSDLAFDATVIS